MGLERYLLWFWEWEGKGGRLHLHLFARSIKSKLEAPGGERCCTNRFLPKSVSPPPPLKPMDALWKLFADVWWWSVSVMVYIYNRGFPSYHLLELKKRLYSSWSRVLWSGLLLLLVQIFTSYLGWAGQHSGPTLYLYSCGQNNGPLEKSAFRPTYKSIFRLKGCWFLLDPFHRRGRVLDRKFCLSVDLFVRHHFFLLRIWNNLMAYTM